MFIPVYKENFTTTQTGQVVKAVVCEKCQTEYFYVLSRKSVGHGTAVYGIGQASAAKHASAVAEKSLKQKLEQEVDLVPCPHCHGLNQEMVEQYRGQIGADLTKVIVAPAILGSIVAGFTLMFTIGNPFRKEVAETQMLALYFFGGGIVLSVVMQIWRAIRRKTFDPTKVTPETVSALSGAPEALLPVIDEQTGQAKLVTADGQEIELKLSAESNQTSAKGLL